MTGIPSRPLPFRILASSKGWRHILSPPMQSSMFNSSPIRGRRRMRRRVRKSSSTSVRNSRISSGRITAPSIRRYQQGQRISTLHQCLRHDSRARQSGHLGTVHVSIPRLCGRTRDRRLDSDAFDEIPRRLAIRVSEFLVRVLGHARLRVWRPRSSTPSRISSGATSSSATTGKSRCAQSISSSCGYSSMIMISIRTYGARGTRYRSTRPARTSSVCHSTASGTARAMNVGLNEAANAAR
jgi:hypothetical protein